MKPELYHYKTHFFNLNNNTFFKLNNNTFFNLNNNTFYIKIKKIEKKRIY